MKARTNRFVGQPGAVHAVLYHGSSTPPDQMAQYLKEGWRYEGEGGMYGFGLYTNFRQVPESKTMRGEYGPWIYKLAARIKDFIVFDPDAAVKIYGPNPPTIADQIRALSPGVKIDPVMESWDGIRQPTSTLAHKWINFLRGLKDPVKMPNGLVYYGDQDKYCAVLFHPENVSILGYRNLEKGETEYTPYRSAGRDWRGELKLDASRVTTGMAMGKIRPLSSQGIKLLILGSMVPIPGRKYAMSKYELTQKLWQPVMGDNPSKFKGPQLPVYGISDAQAFDFCRRVRELTGLPVRLPTAEEWEYAAKGGQDFKYAGSNNIEEVAWYVENSSHKPHPVGLKKPNGYGLYDMSGNVSEWTSSEVDTAPEEEVYVIVKGGGYKNDAWAARIATNYELPSHSSTEEIEDVPQLRNKLSPEEDIGFRLAMDLP